MGDRIVFAATLDGRSSLWIADREGASLERLTDTEGVDDVDPAWRAL